MLQDLMILLYILSQKI